MNNSSGKVGQGHTPGPWIVEADSVSHKMTQIKQGGIVVDGERERIATLNFASNKANIEANAALIAAAPELLEALKETNEAYRRCCIMLKIAPSHAEKAEQAIATAEGRG